MADKADFRPKKHPGRFWGRWVLPSILMVLVLVRGLPHLLYPEVFFDSDQAMIGIMAKDFIAGRGLPWTFYGQKYLLAVESWVAAASFGLFGVSLWSLKLPLILINGAVAGILYFVLRRDGRFSSREALALSSLLGVPSFVEGAYLMGAQGGTVWPLLYVLLAWLLARRPVILGFFLGVAYFHREFVIFALLSLIILDLVTRRGERLRVALTQRLVTVMIAFCTYHGMIGLGGLNKEFFGPGSPRMPPGGPQMMLENIAFFFKVHAPALFGVGPSNSVRPFEVLSDVLTAPEIWGKINALALAVVILWLLWRARGLRAVMAGEKAWHFLLYLALVGGGQVASYVIFVSSQEHVLIRYVIMGPFLLVGLLGAALYAASVFGQPFLKACTLLLLVSLGAANLTQSIQFFLEQRSHPLVTQRRALAQYLVENSYKWGWAPYWEAYYITFLTGERVIIASSDHTRVRRYRDDVVGHLDEAFVLAQPGTCEDPQAPLVGSWQICPFRLYKGEIAALTKGA